MSPFANARNRGLIPDPGTFHMPRSNSAFMPQLMSLCSGAHELQLMSLCAVTAEACVPRACAPHQEKPPQWEAHAPQWRVAPSLCNKRKPVPAFSNKDPAQPKINLGKKLILVCMEDWQELMPPRVWSPAVIEKWPSFQIKLWFLLFFLLLFPCYLLH